MITIIIDLGGRFPWFHVHRATMTAKPEEVAHRTWVVVTATKEVAVLDHHKSDGRYGVRPINPDTGDYMPSDNAGWSLEDRMRIPREYALAVHEFRAAVASDLPAKFRKML